MAKICLLEEAFKDREHGDLICLYCPMPDEKGCVKEGHAPKVTKDEEGVLLACVTLYKDYVWKGSIGRWTK